MENQNKNQSQIAGAILVVGVLIAGAILLRGNSAVVSNSKGSATDPNLEIKAIAKDLGVKNTKSLEVCLEEERYATKVENDINDGAAAGVRGTPTSFILINGKVVDQISGAQSLQGVLAQINTLKGLPDLELEKKVLPDVNLRSVSPDEHILGNPEAKIVIVEYSDTDCPYCQVFHSTMHQVIEQNKDEVAWVYRHYPIPQLHPNAQYEAQATECIHEIGGNEMFWKFLDEVFARQ